MNHSITVHNVV